ncbi:uncharacterized protein LOC126770682 [Nymphalis io]|uniref:uncharacterized protein LOC126770682 n=1 Tax=Inachis io TaxID=171585 RepID=UPI00216A215B|nr:uncharacterized protein LOC126770682 [Nymphalis io]
MQLATFAFLLITVAVTYASKPHYDLNDAPALFETFIRDYNRQYKSAADREVHYQAFVDSLNEINRLNEVSGLDSDTAVYDINDFADYTKEEMKMKFGYLHKE